MTNSSEFLSLTEASKLVPGRPSLPTMYRWATKGIRGVRLNYRRVGRRMMVRPNDLDAFIEELTEADRKRFEDTPRPPNPKVRSARTPKQRERDIARAQAQLRQAGIKC